MVLAAVARGFGFGDVCGIEREGFLEHALHDSEQPTNALLARPAFPCLDAVPPTRGERRRGRGGGGGLGFLASSQRGAAHVWQPVSSREEFVQSVLPSWGEGEILQRLERVGATLEVLYAQQILVTVLAAGDTAALESCLAAKKAAPSPSPEPEPEPKPSSEVKEKEEEPAASEAASIEKSPPNEDLMDAFLRLTLLRQGRQRCLRRRRRARYRRRQGSCERSAGASPWRWRRTRCRNSSALSSCGAPEHIKQAARDEINDLTWDPRTV